MENKQEKLKQQKMEKSQLGDRIKGYESKFTSERIDPSKPFVMRLDGHGFSKFTRGLHKPYDYNFHKAFVNTASLLMKEYHADTAYTHSDEISLLFYPKKKRNSKNSNVNNVHLNKEIECENESNLDSCEVASCVDSCVDSTTCSTSTASVVSIIDEWREPIFGGRIMKITTTAAGYCSAQFHAQLRSIFKDRESEYKKEDGTTKGVWDRCANGTPYFDCRIFQLPDEAEMFSYLYWRSKVDCKRNHLFELSRRYYSKKELDGKGGRERLEMLEAKGVVWDDEPAAFRRGSFLKRVRRQTEDPNLIRFDIKEVDVELTKFGEEINQLLSCEGLQIKMETVNI